MAYFPNGCSGEVLDEQCHDCPLGHGWHDPAMRDLFEVEREGLPCPTFLIQMHYNYDQHDIPKLKQAMTWLIDDDGICQTRKLLVEIRERKGLEN